MPKTKTEVVTAGELEETDRIYFPEGRNAFGIGSIVVKTEGFRTIVSEDGSVTWSLRDSTEVRREVRNA